MSAFRRFWKPSVSPSFNHLQYDSGLSRQGVAVAGTLGVRYSDGPSGSPYIRYVLSNDHTCFVGNWHNWEVRVSVSEKKLDPKSFSGKANYAKQKRAEERIAKAKVHLAEKEAKKADK